MFSNMFKIFMILVGVMIIFLLWVNGLCAVLEFIEFLYKTIGQKATIPSIISFVVMICILIYSSRCTIGCIKYLYQEED